jgi:hypothetical protein
MNNTIVIYAQKTVLRISGIAVRGLKPCELEELLSKKLDTMVRIIGVTGSSIEMDIYGIDPEALQKDRQGIVTAISMMQGVRVQDFLTMDFSRMCEVTMDNLPPPTAGCAKERWTGHAH